MGANYWILATLPAQRSTYPLQLSVAMVCLLIPLPQKSVYMEVNHMPLNCIIMTVCLCFHFCTYVCMHVSQFACQIASLKTNFVKVLS